MSENSKNNWEELARAARAEQDPEKLLQIVQALNRSLEELIKRRPMPVFSKAIERA